MERQTPPPMLFAELAEACLDRNLVPAVEDLLQMKRETPELGEGPRIDIINEYLDISIEELEEKIKAVSANKVPSWDGMNQLFLKIVGLEK